MPGRALGFGRSVRALAKLTWIELKLFLREPTTLVFTFAFPVVLLFILGEIFGGESGAMRRHVIEGETAMDYYVPAFMAVVALSVGVIMLPARLTAYRAGGVLRRFRASLVPVWAVLGSQVLAALALGAVGALLVWLFGLAFYPIQRPDAPGVVAGGFVLTALAFAFIGTLLGGLLPSARAAQGAGLMLFFVMLFLSGASVPSEVMSDTMARLGDLLPLTYAVELLQKGWNGGTFDGAAALVLACVLVAAAWVSLRAYRWG